MSFKRNEQFTELMFAHIIDSNISPCVCVFFNIDFESISNNAFPTQNCATLLYIATNFVTVQLATKEFNVSNCLKDFESTMYIVKLDEKERRRKNEPLPETGGSRGKKIRNSSDTPSQNETKYKSLHYGNKSSALFQIYCMSCSAMMVILVWYIHNFFFLPLLLCCHAV